MEQVLEEVHQLKLDHLDDDWVQAIYHSEFLEISDFPYDYESAIENINVKAVFRNLMKAIDDWLNRNADEEEQKSWAILSHKVMHQKLLTVLAYYLDYGTKNVQTKEYRNNALLAARVYFKLLWIPGYNAYNVYHAQLFTHCLGCLSYPQHMCEKDDHYSSKELAREVNCIIKELKPFVMDLKVVIDQLQLKPQDMNFEDILSNLVDITGGAIVNKLNIDKVELTTITQVIYMIIDTLLQQPRGEPDAVAIRLLFKCLLPKLVAASVDSRNANNLVRASYVTYSALLLTKYGKAATPGFTVLIEHLCYTLEGLERAEVRAARVSLVTGLMSLLPRGAHRAMLAWLTALTATAKTAHRHIGLEIIAKLLCNEGDPDAPAELPMSAPGAPPLDVTPTDGAAIVPTEDAEPDAAVAGPSATPPPAAPSIDDDSTQDSHLDLLVGECAEDEVAGLLRARPHRVPLAALLRAVLRRAHDASGTVRARALHVLADAVDAPTPPLQQAIQELSGDAAVHLLVGVAARCVSDERAAVRRAAVRLLLRLMGRERDLTDTNLAVLVSLCRDASIIVRSAAIGALSELAERWRRANTAAALLSGAGPQLADPENKIQEQVVSIIREQLISRVRPRGEARTAEDPLPWLLLDAVVGLNMRAHLQKACDLLAKTNCLNHRLVDALSTHLGADGFGGAADTEDIEDAMSVGGAEGAKSTGGAEDAMSVEGAEGAESTGGAEDAMSVEGAEGAESTGGAEGAESEGGAEGADSTGGVEGAESEGGAEGADSTGGAESAEVVGGAGGAEVARGARRARRARQARAPRDVLVLALLHAVAPHADCHETQFVLDYFYRLEDEKSVDGRLLPLTLELLTAWTRWLPLPERARLRAHLIHRLGAARSDHCRMDCAALAAHLDPDNMQWATDLMQIYERRALEPGATCAEWLGACDMSLVAAAEPAPQLLRRLLAALADPAESVSAATRGSLVAGLGRLALRSRAAAAAAAPVLARLLHAPAEPHAARVNALRVLADICTRYTCIVEPLLTAVSSCTARSAPPVLRRAASSALSRLLLAGYLRLRPPLYYTYCALIADADPAVREPAEYYVSTCLPPDAIFHHLVDCMLHYARDAAEEPLSFDSRQLIYDVMLQRLSPVQRLNAQCRIARELLQAAADCEADELEPALHAAALDAIAVLCGPRMRLPGRKPPGGDANDMDDLQERVTTNIVSHKMKRQVAEVLVPAALALWARRREGQLAVYLVRLAADLLKDYRSEIEELLEHDSELMERISHFQATIGEAASFGNSRNLVTASAPAEPDTPRAPKRRRRGAPAAAAKRSLRV